jgi:hypothetical protein
MPEITKQRLQDSEITLTHQEPVVCARIRDLFGKKLSRTKIRSLIDLAEREDVDLGQVIENTYTYHTRIEKCRSIFGAISYAIENGGWEMCSSSHPQKQPLPKAVQEQRDGRNTSRIDPFDPEIIEAKKRIRESMEKMGYVYNEALGG